MATTADLAKLLDVMVEDSIDTGHIVWKLDDDFSGAPRYALFRIQRIDGEVVVQVNKEN